MDEPKKHTEIQQTTKKKTKKRFQKHTRNKLKIYALLSKDGCEEFLLFFSNKMKELEIKTTKNKKVYLKTFAVWKTFHWN